MDMEDFAVGGLGREVGMCRGEKREGGSLEPLN